MNFGAFPFCGPVVTGQAPLVIALLLAGLGGSVTHCLTMCSIFVVGQVSSVSHKSGLARLLLPYHLGRVVTYSMLGAVAGFGFGMIGPSATFDVIRHLLLALVATIFLVVFAERLTGRFGLRLPFRIGSAAMCDLKQVQRLQATSSPLGRFALGLSLGFLPCPLVMAALLGAAASGSPVIGAAGMFAFGLGTTPALIGLGFASSNLLKSSPRVRDGLTLAALGINGVILLALAVG